MMCRYKSEGDSSGLNDCDSLRRQNEMNHDLIRKLRAEIARLREERRRREALWLACADETRLVYGGVFRPQPLPPGPEWDG